MTEQNRAAVRGRSVSANDRCDKCGAHISTWKDVPCVRSLTQSPRHTITRLRVKCACLTYDLDGVEDVASYDPHCPVHGWRWDYNGPPLTLEECAERDEAARAVATLVADEGIE